MYSTIINRIRSQKFTFRSGSRSPPRLKRGPHCRAAAPHNRRCYQHYCDFQVLGCTFRVCLNFLLFTRAPHSHEYASPKKPNDQQIDSRVLLLAFSGCAGLRLFAAFVKLDQAYPLLKSRALRTQNSLRTIGWSEVSSVKVMISSGFC